MSNIISLMRCIEFMEYNNAEFGNYVIEWINDLGSILLEGQNPGTFYSFDMFDSFDLKFSKINTTVYDECQIDNNLILSDELLEIKSNSGENNMNCILMTTYYNIYNISSVLSKINFISFDLYSDANINNISNNSETTESVWLGDCEPIIITYNSSEYNITWWENNNYPECAYYNTTTQTYETNGCYVIATDISQDIIQCGCRHTTFFSIKWSDFEPEINYKAIYTVQDITIELLFKHPLGMIVSLTWVAVMIGLIILFDKVLYPKNVMAKIDDKPLVSIKSLLVTNRKDVEKQHQTEPDLESRGSNANKDYKSVMLYSLHAWNIFSSTRNKLYNNTKNIIVMHEIINFNVSKCFVFWHLS